MNAHDEEIYRRFRAVAGRIHVPNDPFVSTHRVSPIGPVVAAVLAVVVGLVAGQTINAIRTGDGPSAGGPAIASPSPLSTPSDSSETASAMPSPTPRATDEACPRPPEPTYLPFEHRGEPTIDSTAEHYRLRYQSTDGTFPDSGRPRPVYFVVGRELVPVSLPPGREVRIGERKVNLIWIGDPGVGEVAAEWREGSGPCETHVAWLLWYRGNQEGIENELIKTIESLE
jgi:hypothetical protein